MRERIFFIVILFISGIAYGNTFDEIRIHGSYSQGYVKSTDFNYFVHNSKDGSAQFSELNVNFASIINNKFHFGLGLAHRNLGNYDNGDVVVNWAFGDYRVYDYLGVRMGRLKVPLGLHNETREMDMFRTCIILPKTYSEEFRDFLTYIDGVGVYGKILMSRLGSLEYQVLAGTTKMSLNGGGDDLAKTLVEFNPDIKSMTMLDTITALSFVWVTPLQGLELSKTRYNGGTFDIKAIAAGESVLVSLEDVVIDFTSIKYSNASFTFSAEYFNSHLYNTVKTTTGVVLFDHVKEFLEGWYFNSEYRFNDLFTLGTYWSEFYPIKYKRGTDYQKDLCVSLRFDINSNWIIKLEGHNIKGKGYVPKTMNPEKDLSSGEYDHQEWVMFAAKATFSF